MSDATKARRPLPVLTKPANVGSNDQLGPLPPCARVVEYNVAKGYSFDAYTAEQMTAYARDSVAAERERWMAVCAGKRHEGCHYTAACGTVCNKCGRLV